jgi:predicted RNase H-like nuclease
MSQIKIEKCEFSYRCPKTWDALLETNIESVRYCEQCDRNVYLSESVALANANAAQGRCVAVPIKLTSHAEKELESRLHVVGLMRPPRPLPEERLAIQTEYRDRLLKWIGIDGCRAGWFYLGIDADGEFGFGVLPEFRQVDQLLQSAELILVDIPIGLPSRDIPDRQCERLARKVLGSRRSSVFSVPSRNVLTAPTYEAAGELNRQVLGVGLSRQSWALVPKIREVDHFMTRMGERRIREIHPELAFWALNRKTPMKFGKKRSEGLDERLSVLERHFARSAECFDLARRAFLKGEVADDDIADAMVGALTAMKTPQLASLPEEPLSDGRGIRMEMVFANI